ncbi:MAG: hypothetical protein ACM3N4_07680 [Nitrososphaerota archaeon]
MFYRRNQPGLPAMTVLLAILWLLLAGYIVTHPDPIGIIVLVVMAIFIAGPAVFVLLGIWRTRRGMANGTLERAPSGHNEPGVYDGRDAQNGHQALDANGAQKHVTGEIPEEGGNNP